jgi:hypothetical protein
LGKGRTASPSPLVKVSASLLGITDSVGARSDADSDPKSVSYRILSDSNLKESHPMASRRRTPVHDRSPAALPRGRMGAACRPRRAYHRRACSTGKRSIRLRAKTGKTVARSTCWVEGRTFLLNTPSPLGREDLLYRKRPAYC